MLGRSPLDLYWGIILVMLLFPILIPFGVLVMTIYMYETETMERERLTGVLKCFRSRYVAYLLAFLFSPLIEALGLVFAYFAITYGIASKNCYDASKADILFRFIIANMLCNIIMVTAAIVLALAAVVLPLAGTFFTLTKLYFMFSRCCKPNTGFEYPRLFG
jgi:uncharacterized membrane protein